MARYTREPKASRLLPRRWKVTLHYRTPCGFVKRWDGEVLATNEAQAKAEGEKRVKHPVHKAHAQPVSASRPLRQSTLYTWHFTMRQIIGRGEDAIERTLPVSVRAHSEEGARRQVGALYGRRTIITLELKTSEGINPDSTKGTES